MTGPPSQGDPLASAADICAFISSSQSIKRRAPYYIMKMMRRVMFMLTQTVIFVVGEPELRESWMQAGRRLGPRS
ncbi:hypothetical protein L596_007114 [Steinernema carpocapsae]|uniref:Uncharacterized protein n=1 Tax=Steinernema carpocapsae TaxID=34508 RepID=A0A4U5P884_STECR|nr:hypothetical protein L596_007114 [Steinernema carpocapsae]